MTVPMQQPQPLALRPEGTRLHVVGLSGPAGCGKSTAAAALVAKGYARMPLAGPLKQMLRTGLGLTHDQTDGPLKEEPIDWLGGATPRRLMQTIGTEWGRSISDTIWLEAWLKAVQFVPAWRGIVVDDVRFLNEAAFLRARTDAYIVSIVGPSGSALSGTEASHASEADLWAIAAQADAVVVNLKTNVEDFQAAILKASGL